MFGLGLPDLLILVVVAGLFFGSPGPDLVERASRLTQHEASELVGRLVTFALWLFGLFALAFVTLAIAPGPES